MQARGVAEGVIAAVSLMKDSGLPCFGRGRPVDNLRKRFQLELNDAQAAAFMRATIADAYDKVRGSLLHMSLSGQAIMHQQVDANLLCAGPGHAAVMWQHLC